MKGFLVERRVHADAFGGAAGVPVGRRVAGRGHGAAGGSGGVGCVVVRSGVVVADRGAVASGVRADRQVGVDGGAPDDRDGELRAVDGAQGALSVGVSDVGGGGVGLDPSAAVLPDLVDRAGAGRVDAAAVDQADRVRDGGGDDTRADRCCGQAEALSCAGGADRLDGDRGRCEVSDRCGAGLERGQGAGSGGSQARRADRREAPAGAGSFALDGPQAAGGSPGRSAAGRGRQRPRC
jgi:hypothetical protein